MLWHTTKYFLRILVGMAECLYPPPTIGWNQLEWITLHQLGMNRNQKPWYFPAKSLVSIYHNLAKLFSVIWEFEAFFGEPSILACLWSLWFNLGFSTKGLSCFVWFGIHQFAKTFPQFIHVLCPSLNIRMLARLLSLWLNSRLLKRPPFHHNRCVLSGKKFGFDPQTEEVEALQLSSNKRPFGRTPRDAQQQSVNSSRILKFLQPSLRCSEPLCQGKIRLGILFPEPQTLHQNTRFLSKNYGTVHDHSREWNTCTRRTTGHVESHNSLIIPRVMEIWLCPHTFWRILSLLDPTWDTFVAKKANVLWYKGTL